MKLHLDWVPGEWINQAACRHTNPEDFFPDNGGRPITLVRETCEACPVRTPCLDYALEGERRIPGGLQGVWAATTENDRRRLLGKTPK